MADRDPLPTDEQRKQLSELLHAAFIEMRVVNRNPDQVFALAHAFHNLPVTMYGWGTWSWSGLRAALAHYRSQFPDGGPDYVAMLDKIRPPTASGPA